MSRVAIAALMVVLWIASLDAESGKVDLEAAEMVAELIGAPVLTRDGTEIGQVDDIGFDDQLQPHSLRVMTDRSLGLGGRTVQVPQGAFTAVRGAVVLSV